MALVRSIIPGDNAKKTEAQKRVKILRLIDDIKATTTLPPSATTASGSGHGTAGGVASTITDQFAVLFK